MLARGQPEGVGVGMAEEVEVVAVQPLHGGEEGAALLAGAGEGYGGAGQVVGQGGAAGGAVPGECPPRGRLEHALGGTVDVPGALGPRMQLVGKVRLRERAQGSEERLSNEACFGLEKGEDAGVLGVFGLHPLHRRQVVDQVLHALVVAVVEVVGELGEQLCWKEKGRESSSSGSGREGSGESRPHAASDPEGAAGGRSRPPTLLPAAGKVRRVQGTQVLHRHLQDLRFLQLPRALQRAETGGHRLSPEAALRSTGPPLNPAISGGISRRTGEKGVGATPPTPTCLARAIGTVFPSSVRQRLMRSLLRFSITLWETGVLCKTYGAR